MMTREEKLYSMTMGCLVEVANKLGIKIDKKGAKSKAVAKILEAEKKQAEAMSVDESKLVPMPGAEKLADVDKEVKKIQDKRKAEKKQKAKKEITNPEDISDDEYVAEVMEQKKELGIECPPIEKVEIVKEKKQKKVSAVASRELGQSLVSDELDKAKAKYKIVGKRIRLIDKDNKCFAYILTNKSNIRVYIRESSASYSQIADVAVDNKYSKSKYNKTATIEYSNVKAVVNLAKN